jgi:hypothetical protein
MSKEKKKIAAIGLAGVILGSVLGGGVVGLAGAAKAQDTNVLIDELVANATADAATIAELEAQEPTIVTETVEVEKIVEKNVTVEVPVDNGDMDFVLQTLEDKGIIEDAEEIVEELKAEDAAKAMAVSAIMDELADEDFVEEELVDKGILEDEDEFSIVKIYSDTEDVDVLRSDFDDEEYKFEIKVKLEDEEADKKVYANFIVKIEDGEADVTKITKE